MNLGKVACVAFLVAGATAAPAAVVTQSYTTQATFKTGPVSALTQSYTLTFDPTVTGTYALTNYYTSSNNAAFAGPVFAYVQYNSFFGLRTIVFSGPSANDGAQSSTNDFSDSFNINDDGSYRSFFGPSEFYSVVGYNSVYGANSVTVSAGFQGAGAVPEPASWAMMVGGFGLVGSAIRRRVKVSAAFACAGGAFKILLEDRHLAMRDKANWRPGRVLLLGDGERPHQGPAVDKVDHLAGATIARNAVPDLDAHSAGLA